MLHASHIWIYNRDQAEDISVMWQDCAKPLDDYL